MKALAFLGLFMSFAGAACEEAPLRMSPQEIRERLNRLKKEMPADEVRRLLGKPQRVSRQIVFRRTVEQWVYDAPISTRVEFSQLPGQEARTVSWKTNVDR